PDEAVAERGDLASDVWGRRVARRVRLEDRGGDGLDGGRAVGGRGTGEAVLRPRRRRDVEPTSEPAPPHPPAAGARVVGAVRHLPCRGVSAYDLQLHAHRI